MPTKEKKLGILYPNFWYPRWDTSINRISLQWFLLNSNILYSSISISSRIFSSYFYNTKKQTENHTWRGQGVFRMLSFLSFSYEIVENSEYRLGFSSFLFFPDLSQPLFLSLWCHFNNQSKNEGSLFIGKWIWLKSLKANVV